MAAHRVDELAGKVGRAAKAAFDLRRVDRRCVKVAAIRIGGDDSPVVEVGVQRVERVGARNGIGRPLGERGIAAIEPCILQIAQRPVIVDQRADFGQADGVERLRDLGGRIDQEVVAAHKAGPIDPRHVGQVDCGWAAGSGRAERTCGIGSQVGRNIAGRLNQPAYREARHVQRVA